VGHGVQKGEITKLGAASRYSSKASKSNDLMVCERWVGRGKTALNVEELGLAEENFPSWFIRETAEIERPFEPYGSSKVLISFFRYLPENDSMSGNLFVQQRLAGSALIESLCSNCKC
jgi:hypothetical protein